MYNNYRNTLLVVCKMLYSSKYLNGIVDAQILLAVALKVTRLNIPFYFNQSTSYKHLKRFFTFVERRSTREPIAYITEEKEFFSIPFFVNSNVLIPRYETELLSEYIHSTKINHFSILDLCTGSGNVVLSIANNSSMCLGIGNDISFFALKIAAKNKNLLNARLINFVKCDLFNLSFLNNNVIDLISANPPYIGTSDIPVLMEDVRCFEPVLALDGGYDGLVYYKTIAEKCGICLSNWGEIILEIAKGKREEIESIFKKENFVLKNIIFDINNIERTLVFRKKK